MKRGPGGLLIGTQHPHFGGGVEAMARATADWADAIPGLMPALAYSPLRRADVVNVRPPLRWRPQVREESWQGRPAYCVGRTFPAVEAWHCRGNLHAWRRVLEGFPLHQVVCGYAATGLPQARCGVRYVIWVATSMDGDKQAGLKRGRPLQRWWQRAQQNTLRRQERYVLERAAWVLALSPHTRSELLERGADPSRTSLLPCPIDLERFHPPEQPAKRPIILWLARHHDPRKNTPLLLEAFARIARSMPESRLWLVGENVGNRLHEHCVRLGIRGKVDFLGMRPVDEIADLYRRAMIFAIPSDQEGLGLVGLEALASGLPVVSTRCGGPEAFVHPGETGLLVERDRADQLADALHALLTDEATRRQMGLRGRQVVEAEYGLQRFDQTLRGVYAQVWPEHCGGLVDQVNSSPCLKGS